MLNKNQKTNLGNKAIKNNWLMKYNLTGKIEVSKSEI